MGAGTRRFEHVFQHRAWLIGRIMLVALYENDGHRVVAIGDVSMTAPTGRVCQRQLKLGAGNVRDDGLIPALMM